MNAKKMLANFGKQKRATVVLESAIILIAFVIIAGIFSFMVINQGIFASNESKSVIQQGLQQASTTLSVDGTTYVESSATGSAVIAIVVPIKATGTNAISLDLSTTTVSLDANGEITANIYTGAQAQTTEKTFDDFVQDVTNTNTGIIILPSGDTTQTLNSGAQGYLVIALSGANEPAAGSQVTIEITPEQTAPVTIQIPIPTSMLANTWVSV